MTKALCLFLSLLLAGCRDERPAGPTAAEADQLNAAEELLDAEAGNAKGTEDRSPVPAQ